jgi:hypothetical protein
MSFRDGLKLAAYQETIDAIKRRIKALESSGRPMVAENAARLETYREVLDMLECGGGLLNWY